MNNQRVILLILDGWGIAKDPSRSAIDQANTPFIDSLYQKYPHSTLVTFGEKVGLPEGQMGNSEVGHLNIGAGRIVYQDFARINKDIESGDFETQPQLIKFFQKAQTKGGKVHFIGLVSDGGVHSHVNHLKALTTAAQKYNLEKVCIHAFMDGRDCDPKSGKGHLQNVEDHIADMTNTKISSVIGRYYAMDRDKRWERTKKAYDLLVNRHSDLVSTNILETIQSQYEQKITDEFLPAIVLDENAKIENGDSVLFFNFRTDRPRQLTDVLCQKLYPDHNMRPLDLDFATMTKYDEAFKNITVVYEKDNIANTLGEVLSKHNKTQVRIAETEKYPHVTFFFSGGREEAFPNERRIMIPSPSVATYDLAPEMSAVELTDSIILDIQTNKPDFICLNYANADMVGHTGDFTAAKIACETVDFQVERLVNISKEDYTLIIIADHGNSDIILNTDGTPHTAHTTNLVPCFLISSDSEKVRLENGKLADLAVTILEQMGVNVPSDMTGENLIRTMD